VPETPGQKETRILADQENQEVEMLVGTS